MNRYQLVKRHNPKLNHVEACSPLSVGNGEFAFTADITGMQTLYETYEKEGFPLCTMSQWGWHTKPVSEAKMRYQLEDLEMTTYQGAKGPVNYGSEVKLGNEEVYHWLRQNPHRLNLARIGLLWEGEYLSAEDLTQISQELNLFEGVLESRFNIRGVACYVRTVCAEEDLIGFQIESEALESGQLRVQIEFPYGSSAISASEWDFPEAHSTKVELSRSDFFHLEQEAEVLRKLDADEYTVYLRATGEIQQVKEHKLQVEARKNILQLVLQFLPKSNKAERQGFNEKQGPLQDFEWVLLSSRKRWQKFWLEGGAIELIQSEDPRAYELERRIILSQYLLAIQSSGSLPPQETGLSCNSWYGKFHLEMHIWHSAWLALWGHGDLLEKSLRWYQRILPKAFDNAKRNGYQGARWPKMVAYEGNDSPSWIATLLIWQQPNIIYMLEMLYSVKKEARILDEYWNLIVPTAEFMCDFVEWDEVSGSYNLPAPIIPAQEEHRPMDTLNPTMELEYWRFGLMMAISWGKRLGYSTGKWEKIASQMAPLPTKDAYYLAHKNCPDTFEKFNKDHPSMLAIFGFMNSDRVDINLMKNTINKVEETWDFHSMWGWDFALMAMTYIRLKEPEKAIDILLRESPKNSYLMNGHNFQKTRSDLPVYLPGNGSLLWVVALMTAGYGSEKLPGFPKDGKWVVEFENIHPFPY